MSDDTYDDSAPNRSGASRSGKPLSLSPLRQAIRWETLAILAVLLLCVFAFA
ncbi:MULTISPECIES: hypothetical protein [unclassified Streptomyces]|uniref:hypothetical protein n=1 Tax=unclassified Streptomyces TaxID=2593676 RepID=UPI0029667918|nr:hypothetical protein [Streptomyces sp. SJL17-1]